MLTYVGHANTDYITCFLTNVYLFGYHFAGVCLGLLEFKRPQLSALRSYTLGSKVSILSFMCFFSLLAFFP